MTVNIFKYVVTNLDSLASGIHHVGKDGYDLQIMNMYGSHCFLILVGRYVIIPLCAVIAHANSINSYQCYFSIRAQQCFLRDLLYLAVTILS